MASRTSAGTTIGIAAAPPSYDANAFGGLTYDTIGEVTDGGEFGKAFNLVTHLPLASRKTVKKKGSFNPGTMNLQLAIDEADAGQIAANAALASDNSFSFKVEDAQTGVIRYFTGVVMSFTTQIGGVDSILSGAITVEIDDEILVA